MRPRDDRGAILIHTAITIMMLTSLAAFVLDAGVLWVARRQAQNAADAGALAGATTRALDEFVTPPNPGGPTESTALTVARSNLVFGKVPGVPAPQYDCPASAFGGASPSGCVRVDVYADGSNGSTALPVYFAGLFGQTTQRARATATAQAVNATYSDCLQPWLIPDGPLTGYGAYSQPGPGAPGSGWGTDDVGATLTLEPGDPTLPLDATVMRYYEIEDEASYTYADAIEGCNVKRGLQDTLTTSPLRSSIVTDTAVGNALAANGGTMTVPIALISPADYTAATRVTGHFALPIVNVIGLRITQPPVAGILVGTITGVIGELKGAAAPVAGDKSLFHAVNLVR